MLFEVMTGKGLSDNATKSGNRLAVERQTLSEHNDLLNPAVQFPKEYYEVMSMPPGPVKSMLLEQLKLRTEETEKDFPRYWNDEVPRKPVSQSSSFIGNINFDPNSNMANVQMGDKLYLYPMTSNEVADWLNSPSMERYFHDYVKYK